VIVFFCCLARIGQVTRTHRSNNANNGQSHFTSDTNIRTAMFSVTMNALLLILALAANTVRALNFQLVAINISVGLSPTSNRLFRPFNSSGQSSQVPGSGASRDHLTAPLNTL
jgi:hypothetical protein